MSTTLQELPTFPDETLGALSPSALLSLLIENEDRVPRNVIDECARRGDDMVETTRVLVENDRSWSDEAEPGEWWALLHAAMILGLIASERAGLLLARLMDRMAREEDDNLQEWLAGYWPALFRNKPDSVLHALRAVSEDRSLDWYARLNAVEPIVAGAQARGPEALASALAWVAGIAANEEESWDLRLLAANLLLEFPRPEYRPLLDDLAQRQEGLEKIFSAENVQESYSALADRPQWERFANPWRDFYAPVAIERRQERWAEEESSEDDSLAEPMLPYVRATEKVGRNDPCPCGSGKKYKRCCLPNEA